MTAREFGIHCVVVTQYRTALASVTCYLLHVTVTYMSTPVEQIKERLSIAEVVGSYLKLERAGNSLKAKCPFHNEKTPSFFVSPGRGSYYCFGCNKGGDIFSFVQEFEGLDFVGALRVLAARAGVELRRVDPKVKSEYARLYLLLEKAARFFELELAASGEARAYLDSRGLLPGTITQWRLGFARNEWRGLLRHLAGEGFNPEEMEKVGLIKRARTDLPAETSAQTGAGSSKQGTAVVKFYDTFRGRIMFPIMDGASRVIGFSGRILPQYDDGKAGKYINSPETLLFNKSRVLYGFDKAKLPMRQGDAAILVEGQMDLVMAYQAGSANTVASSGTALTPEHLALLRRMTNNLLLSFDADSAGVRASERAIRLALAEGFAVKVIALRGGKDPAELIAKDKTEWEKAVSGAVHVIEFLAEETLRSGGSSREQALAVEQKILPLIALLQSPVEQSHFLKYIGEKTGLREEALWQAFRKISKAALAAVPALAQRSELRERKDGSPATAARIKTIGRKIWGLLFFAAERGGESGIQTEEARTRLRAILGEKRLAEFDAEFLREKEALLFEGEAFALAGSPASEIEELLRNLEEENVVDLLSEALERLHRAERGGKKEEVTSLLSECKELSERSEKVKAARFAK